MVDEVPTPINQPRNTCHLVSDKSNAKRLMYIIMIPMHFLGIRWRRSHCDRILANVKSIFKMPVKSLYYSVCVRVCVHVEQRNVMNWSITI